VLRGQFEVTIDDKGRLVMPSRCQSAFVLKPDEKDAKVEQETEEASEAKGEEGKNIKGRLVIAPDVNSKKRLLVYPLDKWEEVERDWEKRPEEEKDEHTETLLAAATPVDLDAKGRFALPAYLVKQIGFELKELAKEKFYLIGKKNKLELWKKELWDEACSRADAARQEREELIRKREELEQVSEKIRKEAAEEVMKELMEEVKAGKEAMKKEIKEALLAGQKSKSWEELAKGLQGFRM